MSWLRIISCLFVVCLVMGQSGFSQNPTKGSSASPELVNQLTQQLSITRRRLPAERGHCLAWPRADLARLISTKSPLPCLE